jgi:enediyne biosynthesis thioesterase
VKPLARAYEFEHVVGFQETNFLGNVYFVHPIAWQGRCRELFLHDEAPEVLEALTSGLQLLTARCSCEYLAELKAFDRVVVRMRLGAMSLNRIILKFEYWLGTPNADALVARGEQEVVCMRAEAGQQVAAPIPEALARALGRYT